MSPSWATLTKSIRTSAAWIPASRTAWHGALQAGCSAPLTANRYGVNCLSQRRLVAEPATSALGLAYRPADGRSSLREAQGAWTSCPFELTTQKLTALIPFDQAGGCATGSARRRRG